MHTAKAAARKRKRQSLTLTLLLMGGVVGGLLFPFLNNAMQDTPAYESVVVVDFTSFDKASAAPSRAKSAAPRKAAEQPISKPSPKPTPRPVKKPVVTAPTPAPPVPATPEPEPTPEPAVEDVPAPSPEPETTNTAEADAKTSSAAAATGTAASGTGSTDGTATADGDGDSATPGTGEAGRDFSGDGIFGRRVVYRANVKGLTREPGKLVVNLCVNRTGTVTYVALNREETTISDPELQRNAQRVTRKYKFEKDYTAPREQCGKLSFIFKLPAD